MSRHNGGGRPKGTGRKCKCGERFIPRMSKQRHCLYCILKLKPQKPENVNYAGGSTEFDEWVVYSWHNIQRNLAKMKGVPFVFDDGIVKTGGDAV